MPLVVQLTMAHEIRHSFTAHADTLFYMLWRNMKRNYNRWRKINRIWRIVRLCQEMEMSSSTMEISCGRWVYSGRVWSFIWYNKLRFPWNTPLGYLYTLRYCKPILNYAFTFIFLKLISVYYGKVVMDKNGEIKHLQCGSFSEFLTSAQGGSNWWRARSLIQWSFFRHGR